MRSEASCSALNPGKPLLRVAVTLYCSRSPKYALGRSTTSQIATPMPIKQMDTAVFWPSEAPYPLYAERRSWGSSQAAFLAI